jgi:hypothetical protein
MSNVQLTALRAPFPWFGGKSRAAHIVWPRFGDVPNYIEPFAGSLAVPLMRPADFPPRVETVNDKDAYIANFWRAVQADPGGVAKFADWPVNEADLHARHRWLVTTARERVERIKRDQDYFDVQIAGEWVWGQCLWIGSGWCARPEWTGRVNAGRNNRGIHTDQYDQRPELSSANGRGLIRTRNGDTSEQARRPQLTGDQGVIAEGLRGIDEDREGSQSWEKRPEIGRRGGGRGVHQRRFNSGGAGAGQGVHARRLTKEQVPDLSDSRGASGRGIHASAFELKSEGLYTYMRSLQARLRRVRVCCGDWTRVLTPAVTTYIGVTGVFLDPPYLQSERAICYSNDEDVSGAVRAWALEHGENPKFRIALCGYEGEHDMPDTWDCVPWKAGGGYGRSPRGRANRLRERIWFSPHCLRVVPPLFETAHAAEVVDA